MIGSAVEIVVRRRRSSTRPGHRPAQRGRRPRRGYPNSAIDSTNGVVQRRQDALERGRLAHVPQTTRVMWWARLEDEPGRMTRNRAGATRPSGSTVQCAPIHGARTFSPLLAQLALRPDVPVERHGPDPEFAAECRHRGVAVRHRGLGQPHLGFRQRERPAAVAAACPRRRETGQRAFADQLPLELGQRREDARTRGARPTWWCLSARLAR